MSGPAVKQSDDRGETLIRTIALCIALAALAWIGYGLLTRPGLVVGLRTPIQFDDFAYEVLAVRTEVLDSQVYTVVDFRVHNRAVRVDYRFDPAIVSIRSADGRRFKVSPEGQRALLSAHPELRPCTDKMPAGTTCTTALAFDLPPDLQDPRLVIRHGFWIGALVDDILIGEKSIRIHQQDPTPDARRSP